VPLEPAAGDQLGEGELAERGAGDVRPLLAHHQLLPHARRGHDPAQAQCRRERLGHAADVHDVLGCLRGQRRDRRAVVAVLGVVVVLDDEQPGAGPREQGAAALGGQDDAGRVLVGRGDEHRVQVADVVDAQAEVVDRDGDRFEPPALHLVAGAAGARVLVAEGAGAAAGEHLREEREALGDPTRHDDRRRVGPHPAGAGQPAG
jgi:hypothetical protein